jgi:predicted solute-binding protein
LNTRPLVWGLLKGPQTGAADLAFDLPARCAARLAAGEADAGLVPVIEAQRQHLSPIGDLCIACRGPVRSILLLSKKPIRDIRTLALDSSSRSSVMLARILLEQVYRLEPETKTLVPDLPSMLGAADAALLIGDPALKIDPATTGLYWLDLGQAWFEHTGLPMVFAMWSGRQPSAALADLLAASYDFGRQHLDEIVAAEAFPRGLDPALAARYLRDNILYRLTDDARRGLRLYLAEAAKLEAAVPA